MTVTKVHLVKRVISLGLSAKKSKQAVQAVIDSVLSALKNGEKAKISRFGTFGIKYRKARIGRNPKTGETINISERKIPFFKAAEELKEAIK